MNAFGLDIGSHSIKIVQLAKEGKNVRLVAAGVAATPPPGMRSEGEADLLRVSESIKKLVQDAKISTHQTVFALPESFVYTRLVTFPPLSDEEVASAVQWQAEGYIPIPKKDAVFDWDIVRKTEREVEVLLIASPRSVVNKYMKVVSLAGLDILAIETELIALSHSLAPADKTTLIVDFGATSTDLAVTVNKQLFFARSIPTAGEAFTRAIAAGIGVGDVQAEEYKKTYGLTGELGGKIRQTLAPVISAVVDELKKARGFWQDEHPDLPIEIAVLSGGTAGLPEIVPEVTKELGIETVLGNPFSSVLLESKTAKALAPYAPLYAIATGLALREL